MKIGKYIRTVAAVIGLVLVLGAVGTSDYSTLELLQRDTSAVWVMVLIGAALMLPCIFGKADEE